MTIILLVGLLVALIVTGSFAIPFARRRTQQFRTRIELEAIGTYMRLEQECSTTIQTNEHLERARKKLLSMSFQYYNHPDELGLPGLQYFGNLRRGIEQYERERPWVLFNKHQRGLISDRLTRVASLCREGSTLVVKNRLESSRQDRMLGRASQTGRFYNEFFRGAFEAAQTDVQAYKYRRYYLRLMPDLARMIGLAERANHQTRTLIRDRQSAH